MSFPSRRPPQRAGFTLVEMLIVLGILVLLFAMVVPRFLGSQKKAKIDTTKSQIGMFRAALEYYYLDCDQFPATEQGLEALVAKPADLPDNVTWRGPYVEGAITRDPWGNPYQYENPPTHGTGDTPDIWSFGPDGEDGTDDDICSWTGGSASGGAETAPDEAKPSTAGTRTKTPKARSEARPAASPKAFSPKPSRAPAPKPIRSDAP